MQTDRRTFLKTSALAAGAVVAGRGAGRPRKNWVWIPTNTKKTADEWKRQFELMRASGVSAILPEIYEGRNAYFGSTRLPVKSPWLETLLPLAHGAGLEVHAWMWTMPCLIESVMQAHPDWYNVNAKGECAVDKPAYVDYYKFLDPGRPEVREWIQANVKELASITELTGIHLDYVRHPDAILPQGLWKKYNLVQDRVYPQFDYGYSKYERVLFKNRYGADPIDIIPQDLQRKWLEFRWDMVTGLVNDFLVPAAHAKNKIITAAVFPGPALARINVRQDWGRWRLDAFLPMLYNSFYNAGPEWVAEQTREGVTTVKQPVYSGLFVHAMDEAALTRTATLAVEAGASGVAIFSDGGMNDAKWKALAAVATA